MTSRDDTEPTADVSGVFVHVIPATLHRACGSCNRVVSTILAAEGLADPDPTAWYALDDCLSVYDSIEVEVGRCTLFLVGRGLARSMDWPSAVTTIDDALTALADQYDRYHRGTDQWSITVDSDRPGCGRVTFETPYPTLLEAGLIRGIDDRFGDEETFLAVRRGPFADCLSVRWWDDGITHVEDIVPHMTRGEDLEPDLRRANRVGTPASR
ncbi:MAG: hypothetical protein ACOCYZ_01940 [Halococcoides sp.]